MFQSTLSLGTPMAMALVAGDILELWQLQECSAGGAACKHAHASERKKDFDSRTKRKWVSRQLKEPTANTHSRVNTPFQVSVLCKAEKQISTAGMPARSMQIGHEDCLGTIAVFSRADRSVSTKA